MVLESREQKLTPRWQKRFHCTSSTRLSEARLTTRFVITVLGLNGRRPFFSHSQAPLPNWMAMQICDSINYGFAYLESKPNKSLFRLQGASPKEARHFDPWCWRYKADYPLPLPTGASSLMNSRNMLTWHSKKTNVANVYHNNTKCRAGNRIETRYVKQGTDGRPLCRRCDALNGARQSTLRTLRSRVCYIVRVL